MDGPNVNLSFEKKLQSIMETTYETGFLNFGTCSLHPVHTAFRKGIKKLDFDVDEFFHDIHFFFKHSSVRREDYASLEETTEVAARYALQHSETRWLSMKFVAVRIMQQWKNLEEYFLKFLPQQSNFKHAVATTARYKRICAALQNPLSLAYISFCAFSAEAFEDFLVPFQSDEPKVHLLYPSMCKLISNLMQKFIRKKVLSSVYTENLLIDIHFRDNIKPLSLVEVGTKAKSVLNEQTQLFENSKSKVDNFRKECINFYLSATTHLLDRLPFNVPVIKHAQYLHPCRRNDSGATNAISNMALIITSVVSNKLPELFDMKGHATKEEVCDKIRMQWMEYQGEELKDDWYKKTENNEGVSRDKCQIYWPQALQDCGLKPTQLPSSYKRIDHFWSKIGALHNEHGVVKYPQLFSLIRIVLSLSHGNAYPEQGFSINKQLMESHGYATGSKTIASLRMVKDKLYRVGGVLNLPLTVELFHSVKSARAKYFADMEQEKLAAETAKKQELLKKHVETTKKSNKEKADEIAAELERLECDIQVADAIIQEGNEQLQKLISSKNLNRKELQSAQSKLDIGLQRKRKCVHDIANLKKKKRNLPNGKK